MTEQEQDYPTGWRPDPGEKVKGVVTDIATGEGGYGPYPIVTLGAEDGGEVAVHAFHTVLRTELAKRRPKIGDELEITYDGKRPNRSGKGDYHSYKVRGGQVQGYNWDADLPDGGVPVSDVTPPMPPVTTAREIADRQAPAVVPAGAAPDPDDSVPF